MGRGVAAGFGVLIAFALPRVAAAATEVAPGQHAAETWTAAGSPYHLQADATFAGLTIEAGTTVLFATLDGGATKRVLLQATTISVEGTRENPVTFRPDVDTTAPDAWQGIWVSHASIRGARVLNAAEGIRLVTGSSSVSESVFENCTYALMVGSSGFTQIDAVLVTGAQTHGVRIMGVRASEIHVSNSVFRSVYSAVEITQGTVAVTNCTIDHAHTGIAAGATDAVVELQNTLITYSLEALSFLGGVSPPPTITFTTSVLWGNGHHFVNLAHLTQPAGVLFVDPRYVAVADLHLAAGSPCIDAGTAGVATQTLDHDFDLQPRPRGPFDIGAYEYAASGGNGGSGGAGAGTGGGGGTGGPGSAGTTGASGSAGGASGASGSTGGVAGTAGASGSSGSSGATGASGLSGATGGGMGGVGGTAGAAGASGSMGGGRAGAAGTAGARAGDDGCGCGVAETSARASVGWLFALLLVARFRRRQSPGSQRGAMPR